MDILIKKFQKNDITALKPNFANSSRWRSYPQSQGSRIYSFLIMGRSKLGRGTVTVQFQLINVKKKSYLMCDLGLCPKKEEMCDIYRTWKFGAKDTPL